MLSIVGLLNEDVSTVKEQFQVICRRGGMQQQNHSDCGVFVLTNAMFLVDDLPPTFRPDPISMIDQRYRIALSILDQHVRV